MKFDDHYFRENEMTDEMIEHFKTRTDKHIKLVQKYCKKIDDLCIKGLEDIVKVSEQHDKSKYEEPEYTPYVYVSWDYKCKDDGIDFSPPQEIKEDMNKATKHHVTNNKHHAEYYDKENAKINREDRDKPPDEMINATQMPEQSVAEMVADWCAMSEEKGTNTPQEWADNNVNVRWKFTEEQKELMYELMNKIWEKPDEI